MPNTFVRLCRGVTDRGVLLPETEVAGKISGQTDKDWYRSVFYYDQDQYAQFSETGTVRGIKDVVTNKLVFDFDNKADPEFARFDAITLAHRLAVYGIESDYLDFYFSGNKGYNVVVNLDRTITPEEAGELALNFAADLKTFDRSMYDAVQILRVPNTRHQSSGLYKLQIDFNTITQTHTTQIREMATVPGKEYEEAIHHPTDAFWELSTPKSKEQTGEPVPPAYEGLNWAQKGNGWKNCKWSLLQGNFKSGERDPAMMILAATLRGMGYDLDTTYYMCKAALKKSWAKFGEGDFGKVELYNKIIKDTVFADRWEGGHYTCTTDTWLKGYCQSLGEHACKEDKEEAPIVTLRDMSKEFSSYAENFDKNIIKTGIKELDEHVMLVAGSLNGLLGQPGAGKTTMLLNMLRHMSMSGEDCVFFSLDMSLPVVYAKLAQQYTGLGFKEVLKLFRDDKKRRAEIEAMIFEDYRNCAFNFKSGMTPADMRRIVKEREQARGKAVKLVGIDYLERIQGPYSDATANTGFVANQLTDSANDSLACWLLLLQTQKHSTPQISDPLISLKNVKGSSIIEQGCTSILTLWREGYSPDTVDDDRYISFANVKNRFGSLWRGDFSWDGVTGHIRSLTYEEKDQLADFKKRKQEAWLAKMRHQTGAKDDW